MKELNTIVTHSNPPSPLIKYFFRLTWKISVFDQISKHHQRKYFCHKSLFFSFVTAPSSIPARRTHSRTASNSARQSRLLPSQLSFPAAPPTEACPGPIHPSALRMASPPCSLFPPGARCGFLAPPCPLRAPGAAVPRACRLQAPAATVPRCGLVIRAPAAGSGR